MNIKNFIEYMGNIFGKKSKVILSLEIGQEWIKAAASKEIAGIPKIIKLAARKTTGSDKDAVAQAIKALVAELGVGQFSLAVSLPRHSVTVRYMGLPSTDPAEIENIASLQAIKQLPYPKDDIIIAHKILQKDAEGYSKVMLVVVHKNVINRHLDILKGCGLAPELISLSSEAINRYFLLTKFSSKADAAKATTLIDMDSSFTEVQIYHNKRIVFSRSLHHGLKDFENMGKRKTWIEEIKLSFSTYGREKDSVDITDAVLTGAAWRKEGIDKVLSAELTLPVEVVYPLGNIRITPAAEAKFGKDKHPVSFSSVIALALNFQQMEINLLPGPIQLLQEKKVKYKKLLNIGILAVCFIFALSVFLLKKLHDKEVYLKLLEKKLESVVPEAEVLNRKAKMVRMIKGHLKAEGSCLDIVREAYAITPANIYLTKFIFDEGKSITLKGNSPNMSGVFKFVTVLEESDYFRNVQLRYASKRKVKAAEIIDFEIYAPLR